MRRHSGRLLPLAVLLAVSPAAAPVQGVRVHADLNARVNAVYHALAALPSKGLVLTVD